MMHAGPAPPLDPAVLAWQQRFANRCCRRVGGNYFSNRNRASDKTLRQRDFDRAGSFGLHGASPVAA